MGGVQSYEPDFWIFVPNMFGTEIQKSREIQWPVSDQYNLIEIRRILLISYFDFIFRFLILISILISFLIFFAVFHVLSIDLGD